MKSRLYLANEISLELFGKVTTRNTIQKSFNINRYFKILGGVIIKDANRLSISDLEEIVDLVQNYAIQRGDLVRTFYRDMSEVLEKDRLSLALDQIFHYATTYGTNFEGEFFHRNEFLDEPEIKDDLSKIQVIESLTIDEFERALEESLYKGFAINKSTIHKIVEYVSEYMEIDYKRVQNKDFVRIYKLENGIFDNIEDIILNINSQTSEGLQNVKSKSIYRKGSYIPLSPELVDYLENLSENEMIEYAKSFNANKKVWLTIKKNISKKGKRVINKISKLSKIYHQPKKISDYQQILKLSDETFAKTLLELDFSYLLKIGKYLKSRILAHKYGYDKMYLAIRVRNGKLFVTEKDLPDLDLLEKRFNVLRKLLKLKLSTFLLKNKISISGDFELALPVSEKQFVGKFPVGTRIPINNKNLFFGISWKGRGVDYDLSAISTYDKIGWNGTYNSDEMFYSGDITSAPLGATELIFTKELKQDYAIKVNHYSGDAVGFKFFIGNQTIKRDEDFKKPIEKIVDVDNIIFNYFFKDTGELTLGIIDENYFVFLNFTSDRRVSSEMKEETQKALKLYKDSFITFKDIYSNEDIETLNSLLKAQETKELNLNNPDKQLLLDMLNI